MATIYADNTGAIIGVANSVAEDLQYFPSPPDGTTCSLEFDENNNRALLLDVLADILDYRLVSVNGVAQLQKDGAAAAAVQPPCPLYSVFRPVLTEFGPNFVKAAIVASWQGTATVQQQQQALAYVLLKLSRAGLL